MLQRIGETGSLPEPFAADPGRFFLAIHHRWVDNGGKLAGKPRNSIRNLADLLETKGTPVRSLRSKINGETRLKIDDAVALLDIYFSHWRFETAEGGGDSGYVPLRAGNLKEIRNPISSFLFQNQTAIHLPEAEKRQRSNPKTIEAEPVDAALFLAGRDVIPENFRTSSAVMTISRVGSVAGPTTATAIRAFCEIIDSYWQMYRKDEVNRTLIWIVDPGDRDIRNEDSLAAFANAEQLATFFRAVRLMNNPGAEARWSWLSAHAVVLVGSMDVAITDRLYASESERLESIAKKADSIPRGIKYSHFLLDTPPPNWLRLPQFALLYGEDFEELEKSSFMLWLDDAETQWRYFGYAPALTPILSKDGTPSFAKFLELDSPGPIYDRAASIVHAAACFRLESCSCNVTEDEQLRSMITLRHLDFAVFLLSEFLNAETLSRQPSLTS
ncbi:MAG: hypothetical protein OEU92_15930 [Alphaproteobacteria bacterium]|nr:hypothetical protein [Alphaproteobacteria bacterium]